MDGSGPIQFAISTPSEDLQSHIEHSLSLGLPEADCGGKSLTLIANGPSARGIKLPDASMAINGALDLFTAQGIAPQYWICCDPQPLVADMLTDAPEETTYLVASKCHPSVFERLRNRNVRLWHVNDQPIPNVQRVPCAVSVTLCALMLASRLGYRQIDVWGWDCCYDGQEHHAGTGELSVTAERIYIEVGDAPDSIIYESNATWACEVQDALKILPVLKWAGTTVRIHGRSMLGEIVPEYAA